jgi:hypothetical protein
MNMRQKSCQYVYSQVFENVYQRYHMKYLEDKLQKKQLEEAQIYSQEAFEYLGAATKGAFV